MTHPVGRMVIYLMEELGDARLRCEDVKGYVDKARTLVEHSTHKDHLVEVAGDIIHGLPDALLKLDKALAATAMAAAKMDYELMASELRPQKADALDAVMNDLRIKRIPRRSSMNRIEVAKKLKVAAKVLKACDCMGPVGPHLVTTVNALEGGQVTAAGEAPEGQPVASTVEAASEVLETLAGSLQSAEAPTPRELAASIRKVLADFHGNPANRETLRLWKVAQTRTEMGEGLLKVGYTVDRAKRVVFARFEAGKSADPTQNMSEEDKATWKEMNDKYKDVVKDMHKAAQQQQTQAQQQEQKQSGAGEEFQKENPKITDEEVAEINRQHEKNKDVVKDQAKSAFSYWRK